MPNTGERREITSQANAKEAETIQRSKKLLAKTKQLVATADAKNLVRSAQARKSAGAFPTHASKDPQGQSQTAASEPFADSHQGAHTARRPALASRADVRQAVRGLRD